MKLSSSSLPPPSCFYNEIYIYKIAKLTSLAFFGSSLMSFCQVLANQTRKWLISLFNRVIVLLGLKHWNEVPPARSLISRKSLSKEKDDAHDKQLLYLILCRNYEGPI